jgi:hypothetical protein
MAAAPAIAGRSHSIGQMVRARRSAKSPPANGRNIRISPAMPASISRDQWVS